MYKITAASHDKACDGIAMGFRAGATLMDMEMVQFHPTGLLVGQNQISGTVFEEGLRGAGAYLRNGLGERYMEHYDPRGERATRDVVSRSSYLEIMAGRGTEEEGVLIDISHLGAEFVEGNFPGMTKRCRDVGFDLAREPVTVVAGRRTFRVRSAGPDCAQPCGARPESSGTKRNLSKPSPNWWNCAQNSTKSAAPEVRSTTLRGRRLSIWKTRSMSPRRLSVVPWPVRKAEGRITGAIFRNVTMRSFSAT